MSERGDVTARSIGEARVDLQREDLKVALSQGLRFLSRGGADLDDRRPGPQPRPITGADG